MRSEVPRIFVVNLFGDRARRQHISRQLDALELQYEFSEAVSKDCLTDAHYQLYDDQSVQKRVQRSLTPGEMACAFSHAEVWQEVLRRNLEAAIVLEDDAVIEPQFLDAIRHLDRFPDDWEMLNFCSSGISERTDCKVSESLTVVRFLERMNGTVGYCANRAGFEKMLKHVYPLKAAADGLLSSLVKIKLLTSYGTNPQLVSTTELFDSSIGQRTIR